MDKKTFSNSLRRDCFKRISKDEIFKIFEQEVNQVNEAAQKHYFGNANNLFAWTYEKLFMLVRAKYDIELAFSENQLYLLAKKREKTTENKKLKILGSFDWFSIEPKTLLA